MNKTLHGLAALLTALLGALAPAPAGAVMPVIDLQAVMQLISQIRTMQAQLQTARSQLTQAQSAYEAISGHRGMETLLGGTVRNYLPADWQQLVTSINGLAAPGNPLGAQVHSLQAANAVLSDASLQRLAPAEQVLVREARANAATLAALSQLALAHASAGFDNIQQLISTIGSATDEKAILDLQARIGAESGMLQNEQTKLQTLYAAAAAQEQLRGQRRRELAIAGYGTWRDLPPLGL